MNSPLPDPETLYSALLKKESDWEGLFFVGVKTTGVFCRPTCTARKPKRENVEFFKSAKDALENGYRPCKICTPMQYKGAPPPWLEALFAEIDENPHLELKDRHLRERGLDPNRVRYWFKKQVGLTFHGYLRVLRIARAFGRIKLGDPVTDTAFSVGYQSLSGFSDAFKKTTGFSPGDSQEQQLVQTTRLLTPLGPMLAAATGEGICLLEFVDRRMLESQLKRLSKRLNARLVPGFCDHFGELDRQLAEYFERERREFTVPLVLPGTPFQKQVWEGLQAIPYGSTRSYKTQAEAIGFPQSVRAVARANGDNRIAILVPCHRVVGANGQLVGYGGGLWRKRYLLDLESSN
jgi:AraC family transcriptional regulator of adaptative response/methylated-DNA-[protein]-cysteine methyltransferase